MNDREKVSQVLEKIAERLDLDDTRYANAEGKYQAISNWLDADGSPLVDNSPLIYPQGSFLLGTVVKPIGSDEYDVDLVCQLSGITKETPPQKVKKRVGDRFKQHGDYVKKLEEMNRCWRIIYAGDFHLDVIPAISDKNRLSTAIFVPDKSLDDWGASDPKGYAEWFRSRMVVQFGESKAALAEARHKRVEEIPDFAVKTPLQRGIQLLKRHRDIQFGDADDKPISIVITTLAGYSYGNQMDLYETLILFANNMRDHIDERGEVDWIANPVNPEENFADKWQEHPERKMAFYQWLENLNEHVKQLELCTSIDETEKLLQTLFGEQVVSVAMKELGYDQKSTIEVSPRSFFDVLHREKPESKWSIDLRYSVKITARTKEAGKNVEGRIRGVMPRDLFSNGPVLPKGLGLEYSAATGAPQPYEIYWQVVNTGAEAEKAGRERGLRGYFYETNDLQGRRYVRDEHTSFKGTHWVEAFVIKNGVCVARSGEFVITIK